MKKVNEIKCRVTNLVRSYLPVICMLFIGVAISFVMFRFVRSWEQVNQRSEFESWAKSHANAVVNTLNQYVGALLFLGDFFDNSRFVTRQEFNNFAKKTLSRYPGVQAFGWNPLVKDDERTIYESSARKEGFDNFEFTERSKTNKLVRAARREEYVIVYYLHPLEGNRPAFGFDIASDSTRLKAITKAFSTGKPTATDRITLVQEAGKQFGILLLYPIYQQGVSLNTREERLKNRKGFVVEVLRVGQAIEAALNEVSDKGISLALYDMSAEEDARFLYYRPSQMSETASQPIGIEGIQRGFFWSKTFDFADRQWKIMLSPSDFFYQSLRTGQAWVVLFGSLLLTTLLVLYMLRKTLYTADIERRVKKQVQTNQELKNEITVRKQVEKELKQRRNQYERLVERTPAILYAFSSIKGGTYYSSQVESILGYSCDHLLKHPFLWNESIHEDDKKNIERTILQSETKKGFEVEYRIKDSQGKWHWFLDRSISIQQSIDETLIEGLAIDFSERKKAEKEKHALQTRLHQAQKLEAIGTLAGGIAHDFNNILSIIIGYAEMTKEDASLNSAYSQELDNILQAGLRAKQLVQQILSFSRQTQIQKRPMKPQPIIKEALKMLRSSIPTTIEIQENISEDCGNINADPTQLHQIIMNLGTNAFHAMEGKAGILRVDLKIADAVPLELKSGKYEVYDSFIELSCSDTGQGIGLDIINKIFDPFFSTKEKEKGTGMGLAITYGIVKEHGGTITVDSQINKGTTFHIFLPQIKQEIVSAPTEYEIVPEGSERILFIDDEELLANMGKELLERLGYHVTAKKNSFEALEAFRNQPDTFDLVITDQTMPAMTGLELAKRMLRIRSDIPIILCTGYSSQVDEKVAKAQGIKEFALKPVTKDTIAKLIRKALGEHHK